ncbi:hypothetical protein EDC94DRAFT_623768 [Helicostylum pulchrum]|nr:hypothetical protein EDC94DRAFT_623768 [Helicostylum pulchrum]
MKAIIKFKVVVRNIYVGFKSKLIKRSIVGTMFEDKGCPGKDAYYKKPRKAFF